MTRTETPASLFRDRLLRRLFLWGGLNLLAGSAARRRAGPAWRGWADQTIGWGAVNAGLAAAGALGGRRSADPGTVNLERLRLLLLVNSGLDVGYALAGLALLRGRGRSDSYWRGAGAAIIFQAAGLFAFDLLHALAIPAQESQE